MPVDSESDSGGLLSARRQKLIASLQAAKYRRRHGLALIEGVRSVVAALEARAPLVEIVCTSSGRRAIASAPIPPRVAVHLADERTVARLASVESHQGVIATVGVEEKQLGDVPADVRRVVVLDGIQDPGNVGTVIRSAAWYGVDCVIAGEGTADFYNPKTIRSGMGGHWSVRLYRQRVLSEAVRMLKESGYVVAVARADGDSGFRAGDDARLGLVLGSEAHGVSSDVERYADAAVAIASPHRNGHPGVESLNVAVAAGILMDRLFGGR